jgi:transglutaminase-like putative cysteine protease
MMLDRAVLSRPLLQPTDLDLDGADSVTYLLQQTFRYDYDGPVQNLRQRLVVVPPRVHGDQRLLGHRVEVTGAPTRRSVRRDSRGNTVIDVSADRVESGVAFTVAALVDRAVPLGPPTPAVLPGEPRAVLLPAAALRDRRLLTATDLTRPDMRIRDWAADLSAPGDSSLERADRLSAAVFGAFTYANDVTTVTTPAARALELGAGVCQDYAHVLLALCRAAALPARYVSGHLLGQGGTHAWVEVVVPAGEQAAAVALDPCNNRRCGRSYLTVATGRDYRDVAPTSGSYSSPGGPVEGRLTATRRLGVLAAA